MELEKLKEPFAEEEIEWRVQASGIGDRGPWARVMPYIDSRMIMERLDQVCGQGNWQNRFERGPEGGVICGISIRINDEWVAKWDGAEMPEEERQPEAGSRKPEGQKNRIDAVKTSLTNAFKRAAVQWGIARYLYGIPAGFAVFNGDGRYQVKIQGQIYRWNPPGNTAKSREPEAGSDAPNQKGNEASRKREQIWEWCLEISGGDVEAAKAILKRHAGHDDYASLYDNVVNRVYPLIEREYKGRK